MRLSKKQKVLWRVLPIAFLAMFLCVAYAWPSLGITRFDSPDESANAFFTREVAVHGTFRFCGWDLHDARAVLGPRSTSVRAGCLVPGTFLGLVSIYGTIGKVIGVAAVPFFSAVLTVSALFAFFGILRTMLGSRNAFLATLLAATQPAFLLFASRPYFHNILFLDLLIFGIALVLLGNKNHKLWLFGIAGIFAGLSLTVRTSEAFWVLPLFFVLALAPRPRNWKGFFVGAVFLLLAVVPSLWENARLYGAPWRTAYSSPATEVSTDAAATTVINPVLPFGAHPVLASQVAAKYLVSLAPWYGLFFLFGLLVIFRRFRTLTRQFRWYTILFLAVGLWLILYYGSWNLQESLDPSAAVVSSSYLRYWLPLVVFGTPYAVVGIEWFVLRFLPQRRAFLSAGLLVTSLIVLSFDLAYADPLHGILAVRKREQHYAATAKIVENLVHPQEVIITGYHDKIFFPDRQVLLQLPESSQTRAALMENLWSKGRLFLFQGILDGPSVENVRDIQKDRHPLVPVKNFAEGILYRVDP